MNKNKIFYFPDNKIQRDLAANCNAHEIDPKFFFKNLKTFSNNLFLVRGITYHKYCEAIRSTGSDFYYIDTGYFGNLNSSHRQNIGIRKCFHRVVLNEMQKTKIEFTDDSRYKINLNYIKKEFKLSESDFLKPWRTPGEDILLCPPSLKVAQAYGINYDKWLKKIVLNIKKYTDRKIIIRQKPKGRSERLKLTIQEAIENVFVVVTFNSIVATEAIIHGVPAITLGGNAAGPISLNSVKYINNPIYPDRTEWLYSLGEGQYHTNEFRDGTLGAKLLDHLQRMKENDSR